jgi:hypothetical protein
MLRCQFLPKGKTVVIGALVMILSVGSVTPVGTPPLIQTTQQPMSCGPGKLEQAELWIGHKWRT